MEIIFALKWAGYSKKLRFDSSDLSKKGTKTLLLNRTQSFICQLFLFPLENGFEKENEALKL